jgi:hypothetical protein
MPRPRTRNVVLAALAALLAAVAVIAIASPTRGDYLPAQSDNADNSAPVMDALIEGDLDRAVDVQTITGPVSVIFRLPAAALGRALGGLELEYAFGAAICLWVLALLAIVLAVRAHRLSEERLTGPAVALLLVANPVTLAALDVGHPEDLLAAALATAAVLLAGQNRAVLTGLALAAAVGSKPWAALAGPIALLVLDSGHRRTIVAGAAATLILFAPAIASNPERYREGSRVLSEQPRVYAQSVWWPLADEKPVTHAVAQEARAPMIMPAGLTRSAGQTALLALTLALTLAYVRRRAVSVEAGLSLLAGVMLARCALDPINLYYYGLPFIVALVAWESRARRGIPLVSIAASGALWLSASHFTSERDIACVLYLAWALPLAAWLSLAPLRRKAAAPA